MDAINRMVFNRNQLTARRERYADLKSNYDKTLKIEGYEFHDKKIPPEVLEKVKKRIRETMRRKRIRVMVISWIITLSIFSLIVFLFMKYVVY